MISIGLLVLCNCASVPTGTTSLVAMPVEPDWGTYTRSPIISKVEDDRKTNYIVSDEFVFRAGQEHRYIKDVKKWKQLNSVP